MTKLTYKYLEGEAIDAAIQLRCSSGFIYSALRVRIFPTSPTRNTYFVEKNELPTQYFPFTEKGLRDAIKAFNLKSE